MPQLIKNLDTIRRITKENENENQRFRLFLKAQIPEKVDKIVAALDSEIKESIDCLECGYCCKNLQIPLSEEDIPRLAAMEKISAEEYRDIYTTIDHSDDLHYMNSSPCRYLDGNFCTIYENRPTACRAFPYTHQQDFTIRTMMMIENASFCPIVFNLIEGLKEYYGW